MCIFVVDGKEYTSEQHSLIGYTITGTEEYRSGKIKIFLELKNAPTKPCQKRQCRSLEGMGNHRGALRKHIEIETLKALTYEQINDVLNKLNNENKELKQKIARA